MALFKRNSASQQLAQPVKRRKAIWEAMGENQHPEKRPLLTLEQFYLHADGQADLWYNISPYPEHIDQYKHHCLIRARPEVWDVLISVTQLDETPALNLKNQKKKSWFEWPNSDHTLIVTSANEKTIRSWFPETVQPDEIDFNSREGTIWGTPSFVPSGFRTAWLWYD